MIIDSVDTALQQIPWLVMLWIGFVGGSIGSFLNVVVYRLPAGLSLVHPGSRCPHCGEGDLFCAWMKPVEACPACGEDMSHQRADDFPAYLNILLTGHIVVASMAALVTLLELSMWTQTFTTAIVAVASAALSMRPLKGAVVAAQWALRMHGFGGDES